MTSTAMSLPKLQVSLSNIQSLLKMEKISAMAKDSRINYLEDLIVKLGYDPTNLKVVEDNLKKKNTDIAALRKQLKMSATEDPLAKGIKEDESQTEKLMKLVMEHSAQIKKMETEMEKLLKEKEEANRVALDRKSVV